MALIGTLRNKMTKWVVGFVSIAILSFILNDLFGNGPRSIFSGKDNEVGEIAGTAISREQYQAYVQERENNYILSFNRQPGEREKPTLQQQAWELLVLEYAIKPQYSKIGIKVTSSEEIDMLTGKNVDSNIKQSFTDSSGNFDRSALKRYLTTIAGPAPSDPQSGAQWAQSKYRWESFRRDLVLGRERIKYENLLVKTNYVTQAESEREYHEQNDVAEVKYLYIPFHAVSSTDVKITDTDLKDYFEKNKEKYKVELTRDLDYVTYTVAPSSDDSAKIKLDANKIYEELKTTAEDSIYAQNNTDKREGTPYAKYTVSTLPEPVSNEKDKLKAGMMYGPSLVNGAYRIMKVVKVGTDTVYNAKASHILIKWENETDAAKKAAKEKARKIMNDIRKGADFAAQAMEFGTDASKSKGGDLGWFKSGAMVKPFQDAVFATKKTGLLSDVVETQYGYHIIDVTALKDNTTYTVATVELTFGPSDETQNAVFLKAQNFISGINNYETFKTKAEKDKLVIFNAKNLGPAERRINNLGDARQMITWLYRDAKEGKVSDVFTIDDSYVVAIMTGETKKGYKSFEQAKNDILPSVTDLVKGKKIVETLNSKKGTLEELGKPYGTDAVISSSSDLKFNASSLASIGQDPMIIGAAFSLENGKRSKPLMGVNGVIVLELQNKTVVPEVGDYTMFKNQLLQGLNSRSGMAIAEAIKESSKIEDVRYKFF